MGHSTEAATGSSSLFRWLKSLLKRDRRPVISAAPTSPRPNGSRKRIAAEESTPTCLRAQTWVGDPPDSSVAPTTAPKLDVIEERLDSFCGPGPDSAPGTGVGVGVGSGPYPERPQPLVRRALTLLSGPLDPAQGAREGDYGAARPSGGHTAVEVIELDGTQESFVAARLRGAQLPPALLVADGGNWDGGARSHLPRSADNIPHPPPLGVTSDPGDGSGLRSRVSGSGFYGAAVDYCMAPGEACLQPRACGGLSPRSGGPSLALRDDVRQQPSARHSRSRFGGPTSAAAAGAATASSPQGSAGNFQHGREEGNGYGTTTVKTSTTTTNETRRETSNNTSDTRTDVTPSCPGVENVETSRRTSSVREQSSRKTTLQREVEDERAEAGGAAPGGPGSEWGRRRNGSGAGATVGEEQRADSDGGFRRHRKSERRNESYSRHLQESRTEETSSHQRCAGTCGDGPTGAGPTAPATTTTTTTRHEEVDEEEREQVEETEETEEVMRPPGGQEAAGMGSPTGFGHPSKGSSRRLRTSNVSVEYTSWRVKTTSSTGATVQPPPPPPPPQRPVPTAAAWTAAQGPPQQHPNHQNRAAATAAVAAAAAAFAGLAQEHGQQRGRNTVPQPASAPVEFTAGGSGRAPAAAAAACRDAAVPFRARGYLRPGGLVHRDLVTLSGEQPYLGLNSRTDILERFLGDADDRVVNLPPGTGPGARLGPPPITPSARSSASIAASVQHLYGANAAASAAARAAVGDAACGVADDVREARPLSRLDRAAGCNPSWGAAGGYGASPQRPPPPQQAHTHQFWEEKQQQTMTTTTTQHVVEVRSSTVGYGQVQQHQQRQQHSTTTTHTTTQTSQGAQSGVGEGGQYVQQRREEVQETRSQQQQQRTITATSSGFHNHDHGPQQLDPDKAAGKMPPTDAALREAAEQLPGDKAPPAVGHHADNTGGVAPGAGLPHPLQQDYRQKRRGACVSPAVPYIVMEPPNGAGGDGRGVGGLEAEAEDDEEGHWDARGGGLRSKRSRRVRIISAGRGGEAEGPAGGGASGPVTAAVEGDPVVTASWDAYALAAASSGGPKSFISRSAKSIARISLPRTSGGRTAFGGLDGAGLRGWDAPDGDLYDKYDSSSRALAAQAQLMRALRPRNAAALTVETSALNPLRWQSGKSSPGGPSPGSCGMHGAAWQGAGAGGAVLLDNGEHRFNGAAMAATPLTGLGTPPSRRFQSFPGNTDILDGTGGGGCRGGAGYGGGGITGRANLDLSAGLAELSAGLAGMAVSGGGGGHGHHFAAGAVQRTREPALRPHWPESGDWS